MSGRVEPPGRRASQRRRAPPRSREVGLEHAFLRNEVIPSCELCTLVEAWFRDGVVPRQWRRRSPGCSPWVGPLERRSTRHVTWECIASRDMCAVGLRCKGVAVAKGSKTMTSFRPGVPACPRARQTTLVVLGRPGETGGSGRLCPARIAGGGAVIAEAAAEETIIPRRSGSLSIRLDGPIFSRGSWQRRTATASAGDWETGESASLRVVLLERVVPAAELPVEVGRSWWKSEFQLFHVVEDPAGGCRSGGRGAGRRLAG